MTKSIAQGIRLVIRHGICSNAGNMTALENALSTKLRLAPTLVDNQTYDWEASILLNGIELAKELAAAPAADGVALVGHSMGGLVCRIANCALTDPNFMNVVSRASGFQKADIKKIQSTVLGKRVRVGSVITLATPNSGALTYGQMSVAAHLLQPVANLLLPVALLWFESEGVADLRTDRIFRILQQCETATPCLTVSGSWGNRFTRGIASGAFHRLTQWAASMHEPHDMVVEDISVDLAHSILPHEFTVPPIHRRMYVDCTKVKHTTIHAISAVHNLVTEFIQSHP